MGFWREFEHSRHLRIGSVLVLIGGLNAVANALWLHTGDIHEPNLHVTMRGGWPAFWIGSTLSIAALMVGGWLLAHEWWLRRASREKR